MTDERRAVSPAEAVAAMQAQFEAMTRGTDPVAWAVAAYRLGMAKAEQPSASPVDNLRQALALFDKAGEVLTVERAPVEHARILNAAGSCHRMLGDPAHAVQLFGRAADLLQDRRSESEQASVLNNLGLALTEMGRLGDAVEAFDHSLAVLPTGTDEHTRTFLATKHNLAQTHLAMGGREGCALAISTLEQAAERAPTIDAAMHQGMISHSLGVAWKARAMIEPASLDGHIANAIDHFEHSLTIFTSVGFPFHHAIAKHNLGHAHAARADVASLQRALASYEDALNIFDPRLHAAHWEEAFRNAEAVDARLAELVPGATRADHTATLLGSMDEVERLAFLRIRLAQIERLPDDNRQQRLTEMLFAVVTQPPASFVLTLRTIISVLMELPEPMLQATLQAQVAAHAQLDPHDRRACDFVLDEAINLLLFGPQRIRVRDILEEVGWERP